MESAATTSRVPVVEEDRPCLKCGYSLRSLAADGVCPECGTPVKRSLMGNLLIHSSQEYLGRLYLGALVAELAVIVSLAAVIGGVAAAVLIPRIGGNNFILEGASWAAPLVFAAGTLGGWWLLSSPDPAFVGRDSGDRSRKVLRGSLIAVVGLTLLSQTMTWMGFGGGMLRVAPAGPLGALAVAAALGSILAWTAALIASMVYLRRLGPRMLDRRVAESAGGVVWSAAISAVLVIGPILGSLALGRVRTVGTALGIGMCVGVITVLVTFVLYGNLLNLVRTVLGRTRSEAKRVAAAGAGAS